MTLPGHINNLFPIFPNEFNLFPRSFRDDDNSLCKTESEFASEPNQFDFLQGQVSKKSN